MSTGSSSSPFSRAWRFIGVLVVGAVALWAVVEIIKTIWVWLLIIGAVVLALSVLVGVVRWWLWRRNW